MTRASAVLRHIGSRGSRGTSTAEVVIATGLARSTAQRVLSALEAEGLVDRDDARARWYLGPEMFLLGAVAAERYDVTSTVRPVLEQLAEQTGESAFFSVRRESETVCLAGVEGSFPLRSHVLYEGIRFPLGVASAGLAILAHLPVSDVEEYIRREGDSLATAWGDSHAASALLRRVATVRRAGYAVNPGLIVPGSWGVGAAIFDHTGAPKWALSLTGVESRFSRGRAAQLGQVLLEHAHAVTRRLGHARQ